MNIKLKIILSIITFMPCFFSCRDVKSKVTTPKTFLNFTVIDNENYTKDSLEISLLLSDLLGRKEDFFNNTSYFDSTSLIIDTIVYDSTFKKIAIFLIAKNPTYRQLAPSDKYKFYYDATCYLGLRQNDSIYLSWLGPSFTNSYNRNELSNIVRDYYFTNFATSKVGSSIIEYNLNDVRFWKASIWDEIKIKRLKKEGFIDEKSKRPHNTL